MSELRQDVTTGDWVVIAPERGKRPGEWVPKDKTADKLAAYDAACPFCVGNEELLPAIIAETPSDGPSGWRTRVVANKFPAFSPDPNESYRTQGIYSTRMSSGHHEVIIETPRHDADITNMSHDEVAVIISTYRERCVALASRTRFGYVILFRNHGKSAGASLRHPHSQVIALTVASPRQRLTDKLAQDHFQNTGLCICCELLEFEKLETIRVVRENSAFIAIVPFAAASPFELWIVPKRHQASFAEIMLSEQAELAEMLRQLLNAYRIVLGDPPYNFVIVSGPIDEVAAPHRHWRLRMVPNLVKPGGFELGTGLSINPSAPEEDAASIREFLHSTEKAVR